MMIVEQGAPTQGDLTGHLTHEIPSEGPHLWLNTLLCLNTLSYCVLKNKQKKNIESIHLFHGNINDWDNRSDNPKRGVLDE